MDGEKSEQGVVVRKLAGKAAMASEPVLGYRHKPRPKRRGLGAKPVCPWKKSNDSLRKSPCAEQKPGSQEALRTGVKGPFGAKYLRNTGNAERLYVREINGEGNETWRTKQESTAFVRE